VSVASRRWSYRDLVAEADLEALSEKETTADFAEGLADLPPGATVFVAELTGRVRLCHARGTRRHGARFLGHQHVEGDVLADVVDALSRTRGRRPRQPAQHREPGVSSGLLPCGPPTFHHHDRLAPTARYGVRADS
jgi:hypothetical protein